MTDEAYDGMSDDTICSGAITTSHSCTTPDLGENGTKTIYITCADSYGNKDSTASELVYFLNITLPIPTITPAPTINPAPTPTPDTAVSSFSFNSPSSRDYTNSIRPVFSWDLSSDTPQGISNFELEVGHKHNNHFNLNGIAPAGTDPIHTALYDLTYSGFGDGQADNNIASLVFKDADDWDQSANRGALKEGRRYATLKASTNEGQKTQTKTFFVDISAPSLTLTSLNSLTFDPKQKAYTTTNTTPTLQGQVKDLVKGDHKDTKVAAGPQTLVLNITRLNPYWLDTLHSSATINLDSATTWCTSGNLITDNSLQTDDKCAVFSFTPASPLPAAEYRFDLSVTDAAGNTSKTTTFTLRVGDFTPEEETLIEELIDDHLASASAEDQTKIDKALDTITKAKDSQKESAWTTLATRLVNTFKNIFKKLTDLGHDPMARFLGGLQDLVSRLPFLSQNIKDSLISAGQSWFNTWFEGARTKISQVKVTQIATNSATVSWKTNHPATSKVNYGDSYDYGVDVQSDLLVKNHTLALTDLDPGTTYYYEVMSHGKTYTYDARHEFITLSLNLLPEDKQALEDLLTTDLASATAEEKALIDEKIQELEQAPPSQAQKKSDSLAQTIIETFRNIIHRSGGSIGQIVNRVKDFMTRLPFNISTVVQNKIVTNIQSWLNKNQTKISSLRVTSITADSAVVSWKTNHPATTSLNYADSPDLAYNTTASELTTSHTVLLTKLNPNTTYYYQAKSEGRTETASAVKDFSTKALKLAKGQPTPTIPVEPTPTITDSQELSSLLPTPSVAIDDDLILVPISTPTGTLLLSPTSTPVATSEAELVVPTPPPGSLLPPTAEIIASPPPALVVAIPTAQPLVNIVNDISQSVEASRYQLQQIPVASEVGQVFAATSEVATVTTTAYLAVAGAKTSLNVLSVSTAEPLSWWTMIGLYIRQTIYFFLAPVTSLFGLKRRKKLVWGIVTDSRGEPIKKAVVTLRSDSTIYSVFTDNTGFYSIGPSAGNYNFSIKKKHFTTLNQPLFFKGNKMELNFKLSSDAGFEPGPFSLAWVKLEKIVGNYHLPLSILAIILVVYSYFLYPSKVNLMLLLFLVSSFGYRLTNRKSVNG